jgi:small-conductance mechanosensitive channel
MTVSQSIKAEIYDILKILHQIWDYNLMVMSGNEIRVSNIVIAFLFFLSSLKFWPVLERRVNTFLLKILPDDKATQHMFIHIMKYVIWWFIFLIILDIVDVPFKSLTVLTGLFGLGIGFGTKEIIYNFCSGMILVITKPIKIGDFIKVVDYKGIVYEINIRYIVLKTLHDTDVLIPSSKLIEHEIINWTSGNRDVKMSIRLQLSGLNKLDVVKKDISHLIQMEKLSSNITKNKCKMYLMSTEEDSCSLDIDYFVDISQRSDLYEVKDYVNRIILDYALNNDITIYIKKHEIKV